MAKKIKHRQQKNSGRKRQQRLFSFLDFSGNINRCINGNDSTDMVYEIHRTRQRFVLELVFLIYSKIYD